MENIFAGSHQCIRTIPVPLSDSVLFSQIIGLLPLPIIPAFKFDVILTVHRR